MQSQHNHRNPILLRFTPYGRVEIGLSVPEIGVVKSAENHFVLKASVSLGRKQSHERDGEFPVSKGATPSTMKPADELVLRELLRSVLEASR